MKIVALFTLPLIIMMSLPAFALSNDAQGRHEDPQNRTPTKIRIVCDQAEIIVSLFDNPASRDFLSQLPLTREFRDFAGAEKIADLPRRLDTSASPTPHEIQGDFTYYAPWGNLAIFYRGFGTDSQLYVLGKIESGKEKLASMKTSFTARIELLEYYSE